MGSVITSDMVARNLKFTVAKDFSKDGVTAAWATGYATTWTAADSRFTLKGMPCDDASVSSDEKLLAVPIRHGIHIYSLEDFALQSTLSFHPFRVNHVEWQPGKDFSKGYLVAAALEADPEIIDTDSSGLVVLLKLDPTGKYEGPEPDGQVPVNIDEVTKSTTRGLARILESSYNWSVNEANHPKFQDGISKLLGEVCALHDVTKNPNIEGEMCTFNSSAFSNDGRSMIVRREQYDEETEDSYSSILDVWDTSEMPPTKRFQLEGHKDSIMCTSFSPDDKTIASSCWDQTVKTWSAATGQLLATFGPSGGQNWTAAFSPDGKLVAHGVGGAAKSNLGIWSITTHEKVYDPQTISPDWVRSIAWSPDGRHFAYGTADAKFYILAAESPSEAQDPTIKALTDWELDFSSYRSGRGLVEIRGVQWLDNNRVKFNTGHSWQNVIVYDVARNIKWHFSPDEDESTKERENAKRGTFSAVWLSRSQRLLIVGADGVVRFMSVD